MLLTSNACDVSGTECLTCSGQLPKSLVQKTRRCHHSLNLHHRLVKLWSLQHHRGWGRQTFWHAQVIQFLSSTLAAWKKGVPRAEVRNMTVCKSAWFHDYRPLSNPGRAACPCTNELYEIIKALTKFNEALTKPYHGLIEVLLWFDFRYHSKWLYNKNIEIWIYI